MTEPVFAGLANVLRNYQGLADGVPLEIEKYELDELEIQKGILQIAEGLHFCHNDAKIIHNNLCPDAILINSKGDWKISGFRFSSFINYGGTEKPAEYHEFDSQLPAYLIPDLDYAAPEYVLDRSSNPANDLFSLGSLIYTIYVRYHPKTGSNVDTVLHTHGNLLAYKQVTEKLPFGNHLSSPLAKLPPGLCELLDRLLTRNERGRLSAAEFTAHKYFDNVLLSTMRYLETLCEKRKEDKAAFMGGLKRVLELFPERVLMNKVLPAVLSELKDHSLLPFTIPNVFYIAAKMTPRQFAEKVLPALTPTFSVREPVQVLPALLDRIDLLVKLCSANVFRSEVMPLVYNSLESSVPAVQDKALKVIPTICSTIKKSDSRVSEEPSKVDYMTVKNGLFPRLQHLYNSTPILSVKVNTLVCFHGLIKVLDKFLINEKMLPMLKEGKIREPAIMMATLAVYEEMSKYLDKEVIATEIMPELWRTSIDPLLNVTQFQRFMRVIRQVGNQIEQAHASHLEELKKMEERTKKFSETDGKIAIGPSGEVAETEFERLVKGGDSLTLRTADRLLQPHTTTTITTTTPTTTTITSTSTSTPSSTFAYSAGATINPPPNQQGMQGFDSILPTTGYVSKNRYPTSVSSFTPMNPWTSPPTMSSDAASRKPNRDIQREFDPFS